MHARTHHTQAQTILHLTFEKYRLIALVHVLTAHSLASPVLTSSLQGREHGRAPTLPELFCPTSSSWQPFLSLAWIKVHPNNAECGQASACETEEEV